MMEEKDIRCCHQIVIENIQKFRDETFLGTIRDFNRLLENSQIRIMLAQT